MLKIIHRYLSANQYAILTNLKVYAIVDALNI